MERPSISRQLAIITPHRQRWPLYSERCRHSAPLRNQRVFLTESQNCLEKKNKKFQAAILALYTR